VVTISSSAYTFPSNAQLRFRCDASNDGDDVYIDEIEFRGSTGGAPSNNPPTFASDPFSKPNATEDAPYNQSIASNVSDSDNDPLTFSKISGPAWLSVASSGALSGTPGSGDVGVNQFTVRVEDGRGGSDEATLNITVDAAGSGGWVVITYDDFESGMGSYTDGGSDMSRYTGGTHAHQGSAAANIQDNSGTASSFYHTASYNVSSYTTLEVDFWFKMVSMESNEDFWVQFFDGSTWQTVAALARGGSFQNDLFYHAVVTISSSAYTFPSNAQLRFRCDASSDGDDVYIDEIEFRGSTGGTLAKIGAGSIVVEALPESFELKQNYPNPFNPTTKIVFLLPEASNVSLKIYDVSGRLVRTLVNESRPAGNYHLTWDGRDESGARVSSGIYFYRIVAGSFIKTRRMVLIH
jgi:hypothetical protein